MGYNARTLTRDPGEAARVAAASAAFTTASAELAARGRAKPADPDALQAAYAELNRRADAITTAYRSNYRINSVGLGMLIDAMAKSGMLDRTTTAPSLPAPADFGVTEAMLIEFEVEDDPDASTIPADRPAAWRAWRIARAAAVQAQADLPAGIPVYKLGEGPWLVTPDEITAALAALASAAPPAWTAESGPAAAAWKHWIAFLHYATDHGGFHID